MGMYGPMAPLQGLQNRTSQLIISRLARLPLAIFDEKTIRESTTYKNMHVRPLPGSVPCEMDKWLPVWWIPIGLTNVSRLFFIFDISMKNRSQAF